jgi:alpha-galactosidase
MNIQPQLFRSFFCLLVLAASAATAVAKPLKVFIRDGQANRQEHANVSRFDSIADDLKTAPLLEEMRGSDGKEQVCQKVWSSSLGCRVEAYSDRREKRGQLTSGFTALTGNVWVAEAASFGDDGPDTLEQRMELLNWQFKKDPKLTHATQDVTQKKALEESFTTDEMKRVKGISNGGYHDPGAAKIRAPIGMAFTEAIPLAEQPPRQSIPDKNRKPVKVFILAGQSNMEGQGFIKADPKRNDGKGSLEFLVKDPATADKFKHLVARDGTWAVRDDVWIHYLDRKGKLTVGYGAKDDRIGPELGFGIVIGNAFEEPVLLIKLAWGGKSLAKDFRPPSSGGEVGPYYKEIVTRTKTVLQELKRDFPELGDRGYQLEGFGWHQGWNDRVNPAFNDEYEKNMANFIRDIRNDMGVKDLPFVIAETGMSGSEEKHPRALSLMKAQASVAEYKEFQGNVAFVGTKAFWRDKELSPTGQAYHWNTNAETYYLIGEAMGNAMKKLCDTRSSK